MRKEADRIWRCLDFVFEPPPGLTRDQKARLILTEIRDRLGVYAQARKLRAPTGMLQRIGMSPQWRTGNDGSVLSPIDPAVQVGVGRAPNTIMGVRFRTDDGPEMTPQEPSMASHTLSMTSNNSAPITMSLGMTPDMNMTDELMNDIDWVRTTTGLKLNMLTIVCSMSGINYSRPIQTLANSICHCSRD